MAGTEEGRPDALYHARRKSVRSNSWGSKPDTDTDFHSFRAGGPSKLVAIALACYKIGFGPPARKRENKKDKYRLRRCGVISPFFGYFFVLFSGGGQNL